MAKSTNPTHEVPNGKRPRVSRRVTIAPPPGVDVEPEGEPPRFPDHDNATRLRGDKPPHYSS